MLVKRFPNLYPLRSFFTDYGFRARNISHVGYLIIGVIWKQCTVWIFSTCRKATIARQKQPMIVCTYNGHKKRTHGVVVSNDKKFAIMTHYKLTRNTFIHLIIIFFNNFQHFFFHYLNPFWLN